MRYNNLFYPDHWKVSKLKNYVEIITDYVANGSFASLKENVKYLTEEDYAILVRLVDYNNNFNGPFVYLDQHAYSFLKKTKLFGGEIIISNVGANVGTVFRAPDIGKKMSLGPNAVTLKTKGIDDFYFYWFKSKYGQAAISSIITGSAQPKFNKTNLKEIEIPIPPIEEQKKISNIFRIIDTKIEINRHIINSLECLSQTLFKHWFIDFEFPNSEGYPYKSSGGKMVESELGEIPEGWGIRELGSILELSYGKPLKKQDRIPGPYPVYGSNGIVDTHNAALVKGPGIIVGRKGNPGTVKMELRDFFPIDTTFFVEMKADSIPLPFIYFMLQNQNLDNLSADSAVPGLNRNHAYRNKTVLPKGQVLMEFNSMVNPLFKLMDETISQNQLLIELRDTLLPKLLSGEIELSQDGEVTVHEPI
ncbi:restriction endonuclease subunit S [Bhargavaea cecembensis]|nr:restriction endonuclease subunit S [Bhargavaea cecembensis]